MDKAQRIVLIGYCLSLVYCCLWVPWHVKLNRPTEAYERAGYGWLWAGPHRAPNVVYEPPIKESSGLQVLGEVDLDSAPLTAAPDIQRVVLRMIAATAVSAAAFLIAGITRQKHQA